MMPKQLEKLHSETLHNISKSTENAIVESPGTLHSCVLKINIIRISGRNSCSSYTISDAGQL